MTETDFCVLILSYKRPTSVVTFATLKRSGYNGPVFIMVPDDDPTLEQYRRAYGDLVIPYSREEAAQLTDSGDNDPRRTGVIYPRNQSFKVAERLGFRYFVQLDDDYSCFEYQYTPDLMWAPRVMQSTLGDLFLALVEFLHETPAVSTVALAQGGDFIGGDPWHDKIKVSRKAMNSFVCDVRRPIRFVGRINEDVNTYVSRGNVGRLFFTTLLAKLVQRTTQRAAGGMTDCYSDNGTYVKSFYSVMYAPSCVKVTTMRDPRYDNDRMHHGIRWNNAVPKIVRESLRKPDGGCAPKTAPTGVSE